MKRQKLWDKYEAVILLDSVERIRIGEIERSQAIIDVSRKLRNKAKLEGIEIDEVYRNIAGITFQMSRMECAYDGVVSNRPASKLFLEVVDMMKKNRGKYDLLLQEAIKLTDEKKDSKGKYIKWLSQKVSPAQVNELINAYNIINDYFIRNRILKESLFDTKDKNTILLIQKTIEDNNNFRFKYKRMINSISAAIRYYSKYIKNARKKDMRTIQNDIINEIDENLKEKDSNTNICDSVNQRERDFMNWMITNGISQTTAKSYISSVRVAGKMAEEKGFMNNNIFEISDVDLLKEVISKLVTDPFFIERNEIRHNQYSGPLVKYINYLGDEKFKIKDIKHGVIRNNNNNDDEMLLLRLKSLVNVYDDVEEAKIEWIKEKLDVSIDMDNLENILNNVPWIKRISKGVYSFSIDKKIRIEIDRKLLIKVLMKRYQNGMKFDSIDLEIFRETYNDITGKELTVSEDELKSCLSMCGIIYKERLFPAEGIINESVKKILMKYINDNFMEGKKVLYYEAIYNDLSEEFSCCYNLNDSLMLKLYLEYIYDQGEYYFFDEYMSKEEQTNNDCYNEVESLLISMGRPLYYDEIYNSLSHLSKEVISGVIRKNPNIILNTKEQYFHIDIFELDPKDADQITDFINQIIREEGYCIWSQVFDKIHGYMPLFIENNAYLSALGIRNAVAKKLSGRFNFDGEVICRRGESINMAGVYKLYALHHTPFSDDDIYRFSKEVSGGTIYFDSLSEVSVRVSKKMFVSKEEVQFDVIAIDDAISTYLQSGYMLIKDMDSFLAFPNIGYEWNAYLFESYLLGYSKKYTLLNNGKSLNNVAGAVVRKESGYDEFEDVCADVLARSECVLNKNKALDYLSELNLLTRKSYRKIDFVLEKAKQIRNRKE